jgi:hypothetical protein
LFPPAGERDAFLDAALAVATWALLAFAIGYINALILQRTDCVQQRILDARRRSARGGRRRR